MLYQGKIYKQSKYGSARGNFEVNRDGKDILSLIDCLPSGASLDELVEMLSRRYSSPPPGIREQASQFIDRCIQADLLVNRDFEERCEQVLRDIHEIQSGIEGLTISDFGFVSRLGNPMTPGCQSCYRGKWAVFFIDAACNQGCFFCPYSRDIRKVARQNWEDFDPGESIQFSGAQFHSYRDLKYQVNLLKDEFDAFAWLGGEPMLPGIQKRILPLIEYFQRDYPGYHQWMYTNGTFATRSNMQAFRDAGIRELRFNLAATDFSPTAIEAMAQARRIFDYVCLEIPMLRRSYERLWENIPSILDTGLDQMNLIEFMVGENHIDRPETLAAEGELYNYRGFITSPVASRQYTYNVIRRAREEKWSVVINDCSNEYKYHKLSVQHNKRTSIFHGQRNYWNNSFPISKTEAFNERLDTRALSNSHPCGLPGAPPAARQR